MPSRTMCEVLNEMRDCYKTRNFAHLEGLIAEAQSMANRMEASLWDKKNYERIRGQIKEAEQELKKIIKKVEKRDPEKAKELRGGTRWLS